MPKDKSYLAFSKDWFKRHQRGLLWLLNTPVVRIWFRWVLGIRSRRLLLQIAPHFIAWREGIHFTKKFSMRSEYSIRIYEAFKPLWWILHFIDWLVLDRFFKWSFGFLTLTFSPDANPETTTVDGYTFYNSDDGVGLDWGDLVNVAGSDSSDSALFYLICGYNSYSLANKWRQLSRSIFLFDTSSLGSVNISSATLTFTSDGKNTTFPGTPEADVNIFSSNPSSNTALVPGDFTSLGSTEFSTTVPYTDWPASIGTTIDFILNAAGIANISLTDITKFGSRLIQDVTNTSPTNWAANKSLVMFYLGAESGSGPVLEITYTLASDGNFLMVF